MINAMDIDGIGPVPLEFPADQSSAARLLAAACEEGRIVAPVGGGTMLDLGAPLPRIDLAVSIARLNRIQDHQPANLTVRADAGITLANLNAQLARDGQYLPLDPPFPGRATVGGILATNASGPLRVRFGTARDLLIGIRVALADGQIVHGGGDVVKNVAGYDLPRLFVGSLGTLGLIVETSFKLVPLPAFSATVIARFASCDQATATALRVLHSPLLPYALEVLDPRASEANGFSGYSLVARYAGSKSAVERQVRETERWARDAGAVQVDADPADGALWEELRDFIYRQEAVLKVSMLPAQLAEIAGECERTASRCGLELVWIAHAVGIILIGVGGDVDKLIAGIGEMRTAVQERGAALAVQRASREVRQWVDVWGPPGSDFEMMHKIKRELDPKNILNPGRFIGGI